MERDQSCGAHENACLAATKVENKSSGTGSWGS